MRRGTLRKSQPLRPIALAALPALALLAAGDAAAAPNERKLDRQIGVFERVLDDALVDSPNWLVQSRSETRGIYVQGHGAVFTFDVSLVDGGWGDWSSWGGHHGKWWKFWRDGDDRVIVIDRDDWDDEKADRKKSGDSRDKWEEREMTRQERKYTRGKAELVDAIADFAEVLSELPDNEFLEIEAFLERAMYFYEADKARLSMRVKMADVRAHASGKIDEKTFVQRIQTKES